MPPEFGRLISLVRAPLAVTAEAMIDWQDHQDFSPSRTDLPNGLAEHATVLLPLENYPARRDLLVGTESGEWTAFFWSFPSPRPSHCASVLRGQLDTDALEIYAQPFTDEATDPRDEPGFLTPGRGRPGPGLTKLRYLSDADLPRQIALYEWYTASSRYRFQQSGPVQPWEEPAHYDARAIRDRFTPETLASYCQKLGVDVFALDYYSGPSVLIERRPPTEPKPARRRGLRLPRVGRRRES